MLPPPGIWNRIYVLRCPLWQKFWLKDENSSEVLNVSAVRLPKAGFFSAWKYPLDDPVPRMLSIFRNAEEQDLRSKMHSLETLNIYPTKTKKILASLLKDCFAECFQLNWTESPCFRPDDEGIQIAVKHFPDLSSDPQTFKRTKLSALKLLVPEKMIEGA